VLPSALALAPRYRVRGAVDGSDGGGVVIAAAAGGCARAALAQAREALAAGVPALLFLLLLLLFLGRGGGQPCSERRLILVDVRIVSAALVAPRGGGVRVGRSRLRISCR
jgi:hypothetical protein